MNESKKKSDLGIRTISGVIMMSIATAAIWFGGHAFMALVILVGLGVFYEFVRLVLGFVKSVIRRAIWILGGIFYVGLACVTLLLLNAPFYWSLNFGMLPVVLLISGVIGTDIGAYFAGRTFGGPKIAPKISPSKTWSGLLGGMLGAGLAILGVQYAWGINYTFLFSPMHTLIAGAVLATIAQVGDFFESWMKRRAGVKDSGRLIPGHGSLFDRADGLIAVSFCLGLVGLVSAWLAA
jgi:phosphatidate cytidylyltransferase